jgi:hypothetical protein
VVDNQAKGIIIWEITGDYIETSPGSGIIAGTPLLDTIIQVFDFTTLIAKIDGAPEMRIYPNPANDFIQIQTNHSFDAIRIFTLDGRLHSTLDFALQIHLKNLKSGLYLMEFVGKQKRETRLLSIE